MYRYIYANIESSMKSNNVFIANAMNSKYMKYIHHKELYKFLKYVVVLFVNMIIL